MTRFVSHDARARARALDAEDPLAPFRKEFIIPSAKQVTNTELITLDRDAHQADVDNKCTYLVGNSLGLQPVRTLARIRRHLDTWATQGVQGHFVKLEGSPLAAWADVDQQAASLMAPLVGAHDDEVAVMQTLSANLHLLFCAFYRPDPGGRYKIILEKRAFPSDHYVVESQIKHHNLPSSSMVLLEPDAAGLFSTDSVLETITRHARDAAAVLLPGIQYYTGQLLDIARITRHARGLGIFVVWDLAHAAGNVPLHLHDWDVDAAVWCGYKYLNGGPGCIGGMFVHRRHTADDNGHARRNAMTGWWGTRRAGRFRMDNVFEPAPGAAAFQLSNPSVLSTTSLVASLEVFGEAGGVAPLRDKSVRATAFLFGLLAEMPEEMRGLFCVVTPPAPEERGAQLSIRLLREGMLDPVMRLLRERAVLVDERMPDVVRVAPAPLYNTFADCVAFVEAFGHALEAATTLVPAS